MLNIKIVVLFPRTEKNSGIRAFEKAYYELSELLKLKNIQQITLKR